MPIAISPGVYTSIVPISSYVQEVPSSTGFIPFFSNKGPDNKLVMITDVNKFIKLYGEPDYFKYGPQFGGGQLVAFSFIQVSPRCYTMRVLPEDATHANTLFFAVLEKPVRLVPKTGTFEINVNPTSGVLTVNVSVPELGDRVTMAVFDTSDPNVKIIVREDGLMNTLVLGARAGDTAILPLTNGSIIVDEKGWIRIHGSGTAVIDMSQPAESRHGIIYTYLDDVDLYLLDYSVPGIRSLDSFDLNSVIDNYIKLYRPKYVLKEYVIDVGRATSTNTYSVTTRLLLAKERGLKKRTLLVKDADPSKNNYYVVTVDTFGNLSVNPLNTTQYDVDSLRPYSTIKNGKIYDLAFDSASGALIWTFNPEVEESWIQTNIALVPLFGISSRYRGAYYNNYRVQFQNIINVENSFLLNIYEKKITGTEVLNGSFVVSFDINATDTSGQTTYIVDVVERYSDDIKILNFEENRTQYETLKRGLLEHGAAFQCKVIDDVAQIDNSGFYYIRPNAVFRATSYETDFSDYGGKVVFVRNDGTKFNGNYIVYVKDLADILQSEITLLWNPDTESGYILTPELSLLPFNFIDNLVVVDGVNNYSYTTGVTLSQGSDGSLFLPNGKINTSIATQLLSKAYVGLIDPLVIDTEFVWIDLVLDGGYPTDVKNSIVTLVHEIRRDCVALVDNGDNKNPQEALNTRMKKHSWNSEYVAIYEPYILVYDQFSGRDIWVTPIYAVARMAALNDRVNEVWYAIAGYQRGMSPVIKDLRYSPKLSERDDFYLNQINPIVTFREGNVLWGQLTSRRKTDALQNLNIMRLILYCKRALEQYCKYFIFEQNDAITWEEIRKGVTTFLADVQRRRGLYSFDVKVWADEYAILKKSLYVDVVLFPTRALEKIYLNFFVK